MKSNRSLPINTAKRLLRRVNSAPPSDIEVLLVQPERDEISVAPGGNENDALANAACVESKRQALQSTNATIYGLRPGNNAGVAGGYQGDNIPVEDFPKTLECSDMGNKLGFSLGQLPVQYKVYWRCSQDHYCCTSFSVFLRGKLQCPKCLLRKQHMLSPDDCYPSPVARCQMRPLLSTLANTVRQVLAGGKALFSLVGLVLLVLCLAGQPASAQAVTWTQNDIGSTGIAGTYTYATGSPPTYTIAGAGGGSSSLTFVHTPTTGNCEIEGRVASQQNTNAAAVAGFMMRDSMTSQGALAAIAVTPSDGVEMYYRTNNGGITTVTVGSITAPVYLRLARSGNSISGYYSSDGISWTLVATDTPGSGNVMPNLYYAGFVVASNVTGTLSSCVFDHVAFMTSVPQQSSNLLMWLRSDVGVTYASGKVSAWADQSGNSNNASQTTGTIQPALSTGAINNAILPAITFNGTSQYFSLPSGFANLTSGASIFVVADPTSSTATGLMFTCGNSTSTDTLALRTIAQNLGLNAYKGSSTSYATTTNNSVTTNSYQLFEAVYQPGASNGTATLYINGTQEFQSTSMVSSLNNLTRSANYIGVNNSIANYFPGGIAEILVYNAPLTASQRVMVESYILSKYGIGNTPTLDAPTFSPPNGIFTPQSTFSISQDQNALSYFTVDGTTPTASLSTQWYNNLAIPLPYSLTAKSLAWAPFFNNSSVSSITYDVDATTIPIDRTGLVLWLRADNGVSTSGSNVTQWTDQSGSGNSASQTTSADQPTLVSTAINGLPAVSFNGTSDFLQIPAGLSNFSSGASVFMVVKPTTVTASNRFFDFGNGATSDNIFMDEPTSTGAALYTYAGSSGTSVSASSAVTDNQFQLLEAVDNGTGTATIYTNGVQQQQSTTMNTMNNLTRTKNYIGQGANGGNYFEGQIAEILIYNTPLTSLQQAQLEGYLLSKYQILNSTSTPAPTISVAGGTLTAPTRVAIEATTGSTIYYTLNGTTPTTSSPVYAGPINITYSQTLETMAVLNGVQSSVSSATYTLSSTQYPAPSSSDTTTLQLQLQSPSVAIPQDSNQH